MFTTCLVRIPSRILLILLSVFYHHVSVLFSSSLLLLYFFVWYSHIESARFVIVYHSCVPSHKTKRSMSRLTNPITPKDLFLLRSAYDVFTTFAWFFWVNKDQIVWVTTRNTYLSPTHTHTLSPHVYKNTYVCIIIYKYLSCVIWMYMYTHVYMFIPMLYLYAHMCTDIYMYVHICLHWHI